MNILVPTGASIEPAPEGNHVEGVALIDTATGQAYGSAHPMPIMDAFTAPTTATWNSATSVNTAQTLTTAGYDSVIVTLSTTGSITAGVIAFEVFDGFNWVAIKSPRTDSYLTDSSYSLIGTNSIHSWQLPVSGYPQTRARLSTAIVGAGTVTVVSLSSSAPDVSIVTVGLDPQQPSHPGNLTLQAEQVVAIGAASAASAVVQGTTNRVVLTATSACWVSFGATPTAAVATSGNIYVPANIPLPAIAVTPGTTKNCLHPSLCCWIFIHH